jgi:hypothetical protein
MKETKTLEESVSQNYVVRSPKKGIIYDQYWDFCKTNHRPFVVLAHESGQYARIILDMLPTNRKLSPETFDHLSDLLIEASQGRRESVMLNPERSQGLVKVDLAEDMAKTIYNLALSDSKNVIIPRPLSRGPNLFF